MGNHIGFKKIMFFSCFIFLLNIGSYGQKTLPVYDGINYTVGTLVYDNTNWWCLNAIPENDVLIASGSLSYSGLLESVANKISLGAAGDEIVIWFGDQPANSKVYYSFIFQVDFPTLITAGTPTHIAGFSNSPTTSSSFGASIILQKDASDPTKFNIAHGTRSGLPVWHTVSGIPVQYSFNTPIFIVACYEIIGTYLAGTPNDKSSMWINPSSSTFENTLPPAATITGDLTGTIFDDLPVVNRFYLRQDALSTTPNMEIDEIRIGSTWASVTPKSIATGTSDIFSERIGATIYPNPVKDVMKVDVKNSDISLMVIYNLTGSRVMTEEVYPGISTFDLSSLPDGMYVVSFKGAKVSFIKKFIKK